METNCENPKRRTHSAYFRMKKQTNISKCDNKLYNKQSNI